MAEAELAPMRACSKCGEAKPLTNEYFQHRSSGRIDWTCRGCRRRGGSNWPDNLVLSCQPCNGSKGAKMPWDWQPSRFAEGCKPR
jgi:5-methylcytosine-specific restriction endonuclease McrA